jgi:hypothetical protein
MQTFKESFRRHISVFLSHIRIQLQDYFTSTIADPTFDYCFSQGFCGFLVVSSVRQAYDSYLDGPLNGETVPQTTGGTQPLVLRVYLI